MVMRPGAVWIRRRRRDAAGLQRQRDGEGLHRRAGLEDVGQRAVAQLRTAEVAALGRVEAGVVGQRQHLARLHVEHHDAAGARAVFVHGVAQALPGEELHLGVDRQRDVAAIHRVGLVADVLHHAAQAVAHHHALAARAQQLGLEAELDAFLAAVVDVGEAHHVRGGFALGVTALVFAHLLHAPEPERLHLLPGRLLDMAAQRHGAGGGRPGAVRARPQAWPAGRPGPCAARYRRRRSWRPPAPTAWPRWWPARGRCGRGCGRGWPAAAACARSASRPAPGRSRCARSARARPAPAAAGRPRATSTTTKRERHGGVLLASSGLVA